MWFEFCVVVCDEEVGGGYVAGFCVFVVLVLEEVVYVGGGVFV